MLSDCNIELSRQNYNEKGEKKLEIFFHLIIQANTLT